MASAVEMDWVRCRDRSQLYWRSVEKIVARLEFTGQISFDWIDSDADGPCVIECNPRAISGLHLFSIDDAVPTALTAGLMQALQNGSLRHWWQDFRAASDVLMTGGDQAPVFGGAADIASYMQLAFREKCTLREAATRDIEWDARSWYSYESG
ncbi:hypothetical protein [Collimonas sp.]|jgi:hypothetical protein|uniref:hypothetical protein n=1 Tax=Collimonas sp. TaxID=1963772 RepID=UPI002C417649|nr:hypothetical protein [Collimonas sp.]HWW04440.1 hypothetical protein [Collimonas sp.]